MEEKDSTLTPRDRVTRLGGPSCYAQGSENRQIEVQSGFEGKSGFENGPGQDFRPGSDLMYQESITYGC